MTQQTQTTQRTESALAQLSPDSARQLGRDLLDVASASETDAFLMTFLEKRVGVKDVGARAVILDQFRKWRKEMGITE